MLCLDGGSGHRRVKGVLNRDCGSPLVVPKQKGRGASVLVVVKEEWSRRPLRLTFEPTEGGFRYLAPLKVYE